MALWLEQVSEWAANSAGLVTKKQWMAVQWLLVLALEAQQLSTLE
jgi:hypothetical protein